jgi:hypothetical protein
MIKNDNELAAAKNQVEQIIASNNQLQAVSGEDSINVNGLMQDSEMVLQQKLQKKIAEYEALVAHNPENPILLEVESAEQISDLPIKASIAFKITSEELAKICDSDKELEAHNISENENDYASEFLRVMKILGVQLIDDLFFIAQMSNELKQKLQFLRMGESLHNTVQEAN